MTTEVSRPALSDFWTDLPRAGKLLLSTIIVDFIGNGLVMPFLVVYLNEVRGFPLDHVGILVAIPAIVGLAILGPAGYVIDRVGAYRVIVVSIVTAMATNILLAVTTTETVAAVAMVLFGFENGVIWPAIQSFVSTLMPSRIRQRYFGMSFTLLNLGIGIGGIIGGTFVDVHRPSTFVVIYLVNAATFLAPLAVYLGPLRHVDTRVSQPERVEPVAHALPEPVPPQVQQPVERAVPTVAPPVHAPATSYFALLRDRRVGPLLLLTFFGAYVGYAQLNAGAVAFARSAGMVSTRAIGYGFTANTIVIVVLQLFVLQRIEGRRRTRVLLVMSAVWALSWVTLGLTAAVPGTLLAAALFATAFGVFGFGETLLQPTIPAITNDLASDATRGRYNALMSMGFQAAAIVAPVIATVLINADLSWLYIGSLVAGCGLVAWFALVVERRITPEVNGLLPARSR